VTVALGGHGGYPWRMSPRLPQIARATADAHHMLPAGATVVAMVSGGADSIALLRLLASGALGDISLTALHVDHMLRGEDSTGDAAFVAEACECLGVACRVVRYDVGAYAAAEGLNLEDAGRRVRYRFADEELDAQRRRADVPDGEGRVAVAHTFDDQMETVVMRLATGAGPGGLSGIPHVRGRIVRPMLDARRADIVEYLDSLGQPWREDATNSDVSRLRARVRAELLPLFESINPRFDEALARTLAVIGDEGDLIDDMARAYAADFAEVGPGELRFDRRRMLTLSRPMLRRTLRAGLFRVFPDASRMEFEHVEAIAEGLHSRGFARDLPDGLRAYLEYGTLVISRAPDEAAAIAPTLLEVPGRADLGPAGTITAAPCEPYVPSDPMVAVVDADRVEGPLTVDSVRPGDTMRPLGMRGTRKLQDVLTDAKVPRRARVHTPVVRDGDEVVWVAGVRLSDDYAVTSRTERAIEIVWSGPPKREGMA
jgi:tRNA(Ile)-lysidine synthase